MRALTHQGSGVRESSVAISRAANTDASNLTLVVTICCLALGRTYVCLHGCPTSAW